MDTKAVIELLNVAEKPHYRRTLQPIPPRQWERDASCCSYAAQHHGCTMLYRSTMPDGAGDGWLYSWPFWW